MVLGGAWLAGVQSAAQALPAQALQFPRDHGSHPGLRTEWWYITGYAHAAGTLWGFQVTFFRSRVEATQNLQSAFAAKQLLLAHAAITDVQGQRLHHDQRIARASMGLAHASEADTAIHLHQWRLQRSTPPGQPKASRYTAQIEGAQLGLQLQFDTTQDLLLQGQQGLSRKGPDAAQASYYYSQPQLAVSGSLLLQGKRMPIAPHSPSTPARAWMDHEWSEALLHPDAQGWDWIGMNLHDGSALTAFRLRRADGSSLWAGGSFRSPGQPPQIFAPDAVIFTPQRWWTSPHTNAHYPVQWQVQTPAGSFEVHALLDAQELDSRASTDAIYWEGLSALHGPQSKEVGMGYLEMTGYVQALRL
jgi:predicted secreted hydrolase